MVAQNRMEKRQKREELILDGAGELIAEVGFFELKMSDLARICGISVGTLYGHFASKEDLLIGLAVMAGSKRAEKFDIARNHDGSAIEKYIIANLLDLRFSIDHPQWFEAEYLALAPSIWKRATSVRHQAQLDQINAITSMFQAFLSEGEAELGIASDMTSRSRNLNLGSWGLGYGINVLVLSEITDRHYGQELRKNAVNILCDGLADLMIGAGWQVEDARQKVRTLADRYVAL
ncbi:TetR/AcrR family transcriptional regulator [Thalassospira lucentensis]|uniref:TetR/AcrR family transcriptional regulator n=1 Tax=Thalassospira lucentensis TaxID=168935 RepID=UPI003D2EF095